MLPDVRFSVLGPVRGWHGKAELGLGSPQQRAMLVILLLARGQQVALDGLINGLCERAPLAARGTVRTHASRLRRCIDTGSGRQRVQAIQTSTSWARPAATRHAWATRRTGPWWPDHSRFAGSFSSVASDLARDQRDLKEMP